MRKEDTTQEGNAHPSSKQEKPKGMYGDRSCEQSHSDRNKEVEGPQAQRVQHTKTVRTVSSTTKTVVDETKIIPLGHILKKTEEKNFWEKVKKYCDPENVIRFIEVIGRYLPK